MKLNYVRRFSAYVSTFYHSEYITILHNLSGYKCINTNVISISIWQQVIGDNTRILFSFVNTMPEILQSQTSSRSQSKFILLKKGHLSVVIGSQRGGITALLAGYF